VASNASIEVLVLWESEIRAAAHAISSITADSKTDAVAFSEQVMQALNACSIALAGVNINPEAKMVLLGDEAIKHVPRQLNVIQKNRQVRAENGAREQNVQPPSKIEKGSANTNPNPAPSGPPPVSQTKPRKD